MIQKTIILATPAPVSHRTAEENLGLGYLASILRQQRYKVRIIDGWLEGLTPEEIALAILSEQNILWIGFACYRSNMERAMQTVRLLRQQGNQAAVVVGGYGPTFHPEEFIKCGVDVVVCGEGEQTVVELSKHFETGIPLLKDIAGISFMHADQQISTPIRPLLANIDQPPFPARDTMHLSIKRRSPLHIVSSRGCAAHCLFCSIVSFMRLAHGPKWRQRSVKNFVDEWAMTAPIAAITAIV
jgi:anaerobic magnesium-protoporphyrin IX monomethyl ester cyclase